MRKGTSIDRRRAEPAVLVRLVLLAADEATGEPAVVGSFLKQIATPPDLSPGAPLTLDLFGERRVFHPIDIVWDEAQQLCIVEVAWLASEAARSLEAMTVHAPPAQPRSAAPPRRAARAPKRQGLAERSAGAAAERQSRAAAAHSRRSSPVRPA